MMSSVTEAFASTASPPRVPVPPVKVTTNNIPATSSLAVTPAPQTETTPVVATLDPLLFSLPTSTAHFSPVADTLLLSMENICSTFVPVFTHVPPRRRSAFADMMAKAM